MGWELNASHSVVMKLRVQDQGEDQKRTWKEVVQEDCQARKPNKEDAVDHCKWRKVINVDQDGCERVNVSSGTSLPGLSRTNGR